MVRKRVGIALVDLFSDFDLVAGFRTPQLCHPHLWVSDERARF